MRKVFSGKIACPGLASGRIVLSPSEPGVLVLGKAYSNLVLNPRVTKGIILTQGGLLSHPAVLAREFRIPCIFCPDFDLKEGKVELDAVKGEIRIME